MCPFGHLLPGECKNPPVVAATGGLAYFFVPLPSVNAVISNPMTISTMDNVSNVVTAHHLPAAFV